MLTQALYQEVMWRKGSIAPRDISLHTRRYEVSFTLKVLHSWERSRPECSGKEKNAYPCLELDAVHPIHGHGTV